jgi:hypothetical protein
LLSNKTMETVPIDVYKLINYPQLIAIQVKTKLLIKSVYINYVIDLQFNKFSINSFYLILS